MTGCPYFNLAEYKLFLPPKERVVIFHWAREYFFVISQSFETLMIDFHIATILLLSAISKKNFKLNQISFKSL